MFFSNGLVQPPAIVILYNQILTNPKAPTKVAKSPGIRAVGQIYEDLELLFFFKHGTRVSQSLGFPGFHIRPIPGIGNSTSF